MLILVAEAEKLRRILETINLCTNVEIRLLTTQVLFRVLEKTFNYTVLVHLNKSWFHYYHNDDDICTIGFGVHELEQLDEELARSDLDDEFEYACIYDEENTEHPSSILNDRLKLKISHGYEIDKIARSEPWPEDEAIHLHCFKVVIHPKDLIRMVEYSVTCNERETVLIHITDSKLTLSAGTEIKELEVGEKVIENFSCVLKCDQSGGIRDLPPDDVILLKRLVNLPPTNDGNELHSSSSSKITNPSPSNEFSSPGTNDQSISSDSSSTKAEGLDITIKLGWFLHERLLMVLRLSRSILIHFTPLRLPGEPIVIECILADESGKFYYILRPNHFVKPVDAYAWWSRKM